MIKHLLALLLLLPTIYAIQNTSYENTIRPPETNYGFINYFGDVSCFYSDNGYLSIGEVKERFEDYFNDIRQYKVKMKSTSEGLGYCRNYRPIWIVGWDTGSCNFYYNSTGSK